MIFSRHKQTIYLPNSSENITVLQSQTKSNKVSQSFFLFKKWVKHNHEISAKNQPPKKIQFNILAGNKTKGLFKHFQLNTAELKTCNKGDSKGWRCLLKQERKSSTCLKIARADESILWQTYRKSLRLLIWTRSASPCSPGRRVGSQIPAHPFHNCFSSLY